MIPLLVAGHGTADEAGAEAFGRFVRRVAGRLDAPVAGGFIELSAPPLRDAVADLVSGGADRLVAVPLMLVAAGHAKGDIPGALARERERHPGLRISYGRPLGPHPTVLSLLRARLAAIDPAPDTVVLLVGRGSTDPDANAEIAKVARLLAETTPVAGVEYAFVSLAPPGVPAALDRCRALGARRVAVLPYFLFTGVLPVRVATQATTWATAHPDVPVDIAEVIAPLAPGDPAVHLTTPMASRDPAVHVIAPPGMDTTAGPDAADGVDTLADLVIERYREALHGDIRMNCDTCVYRIALPGHEHRVGAPQQPHHHPHDHHVHDHAQPH